MWNLNLVQFRNPQRFSLLRKTKEKLEAGEQTTVVPEISHTVDSCATTDGFITISSFLQPFSVKVSENSDTCHRLLLFRKKALCRKK